MLKITFVNVLFSTKVLTHLALTDYRSRLQSYKLFPIKQRKRQKSFNSLPYYINVLFLLSGLLPPGVFGAAEGLGKAVEGFAFKDTQKTWTIYFTSFFFSP